jgi:hypothetical protein
LQFLDLTQKNIIKLLSHSPSMSAEVTQRRYHTTESAYVLPNEYDFFCPMVVQT